MFRSRICSSGRLDPAESYASLVAGVRRCSETRDLVQGKRIHGAIVSSGLEGDKYLGNLLVEMYGKCGRVEEAVAAFDKIGRRNVYSWNLLLTAFAHNGEQALAIRYLRKMQLQGMKPDRITFLVMLDACATAACLHTGMQIHSFLEEIGIEDVAVMNALLHMYGSCGCLNQARDLFDSFSPEGNVVTWSSMVAAYAQNGHYKQALGLLQEMDLLGEKPSFITFISLLDACAGLNSHEKGRLMHHRIQAAGFESEINLGNALVSMYGKFGDVIGAAGVFERMQNRNLVTWNAMIAAYAQNGHSWEALKLFQSLDLEGLKPSKVTFLSMLDACTGFSSVAHCNQVLIRLAAAGFEHDTVMANAVMNIRGKCGDVDGARAVFDRMRWRDVRSWSTVIEAYAQKGHTRKALDLFSDMVLEGVSPNHVTFISVLCACSHAGMATAGWSYFQSMIQDHGIAPSEEHVGCIIDLFGRVGWLEEAKSCAQAAFRSNPVAWITLLSACNTHGDMGSGQEAAERAILLNPGVQTSYILLSNMITHS